MLYRDGAYARRYDCRDDLWGEDRIGAPDPRLALVSFFRPLLAGMFANASRNAFLFFGERALRFAGTTSIDVGHSSGGGGYSNAPI